jgi:hypothetical protein
MGWIQIMDHDFLEVMIFSLFHLGPWIYCRLSSTFQSSRCKGGIYISSLEDMKNKNLHNIHFILSILGSLKHMEHCNEYSTHIERMKRKIHTVTRYTPQLIYMTFHERFGEFLLVARWDNSLSPIVLGNFISIFHSAIRNEGPMYFDLQA